MPNSEPLTFRALIDLNFDKRFVTGLSRVLKRWKYIQQSPELVRSFLSFPEWIQVRIMTASDVEVPARVAGVGYELLMKISEETVEYCSLDLKDIRKTAQRLKGTADEGRGISPELRHELRQLSNFVWSQSFIEVGGNTYGYEGFDQFIPIALNHFYGEEKVIEVLKEWNTTIAPMVDQKEFFWIAYLVDQWEELKTYPIEWALELLETNDAASEREMTDA